MRVGDLSSFFFEGFILQINITAEDSNSALVSNWWRRFSRKDKKIPPAVKYQYFI